MPLATFETYGNKLAGIPLGSSPIRPDEWAPIGLKYLRIAISNVLSDLYKSFKICSTNSFDVPYGFVVFPVLQSSVIGNTSGSPYTVALDEKTSFLTLYFFIALSNTNTVETLFV